MNTNTLEPDEGFETIKVAAEDAYKKIGEVTCPYLQIKVSFNAKGLDHIKLKRWNHAREIKDQRTRLQLLHLAPKVLQKSHMLQGVDEGNKFERIKIHSRWERQMVFVSYYEFIAVLEKCRVRVVVKQIDSGQPYFWSIVPYCKQGTYRKRMFEGDPETD